MKYVKQCKQCCMLPSVARYIAILDDFSVWGLHCVCTETVMSAFRSRV